MLTLDELSKKVAAYESEQISLEQFENWFEDNSSAAYALPELRSACSAIDAALAEYHFDHIGEQAFRKVLTSAVRPLVGRAPVVVVWYLGDPQPEMAQKIWYFRYPQPVAAQQAAADDVPPVLLGTGGNNNTVSLDCREDVFPRPSGSVTRLAPVFHAA